VQATFSSGKFALRGWSNILSLCITMHGGLRPPKLLKYTDLHYTPFVSAEDSIIVATFYSTLAQNSLLSFSSLGDAGVGGAIDNNGTLTVDNSTFSANSSNNGGAIANLGGTATIRDSSFSFYIRRSSTRGSTNSIFASASERRFG
jgi:hypothetical protein